MAALGLAAVGVTVNGWFACSLGSARRGGVARLRHWRGG